MGSWNLTVPWISGTLTNPYRRGKTYPKPDYSSNMVVTPGYRRMSKSRERWSSSANKPNHIVCTVLHAYYTGSYTGSSNHTKEDHEVQLWTSKIHAYCGRLAFSYINQVFPTHIFYYYLFFPSFRHLSNASGKVMQRIKKGIETLAFGSFKHLGYKLWWWLRNSINMLKTTELSTENGGVAWSRKYISIKLFLNTYNV